jgi:hypothetical protein
MPITSSSRWNCCPASWHAAARIERATVVIAGMLLATAALSIAFATPSKAEPSMPPLPLFESEPPTGLIVGESNEAIEPVPTSPEPTAWIKLVAADVSAAQADEKNTAEKNRQEQKDRDAAKNACGDQTKDCKQALKNARQLALQTVQTVLDGMHTRGKHALQTHPVHACGQHHPQKPILTPQSRLRQFVYQDAQG